ncbi:hypothetical protein [Polyangium spumosum]|uniref:Glycosyltransferase RgtA/B/C/D-like domain-containing protein n=1 Tax=Polyangium spumosum TaxID=889282 RepID=A0A6N7Q0F3_9BACT|nr:hypothetical protein [Polyangium spumosum]MRG97287.1 hypothetical protein [Polyangium spumosum]
MAERGFCGALRRARAFAERPWIRVLVVVTSLLVAVVLLRPGPSGPKRATWEELVLPLAPGAIVTRGYHLSPPRRGEEEDVIFTARRGAEKIEIHVVDRGRWPGVRETKSFGVAYETPRSNAPTEDLEAVTQALRDVIDRNDTGHGSPASIPLAAEAEPPALARALMRLEGWRVIVVPGLVALAVGLVGALRRGDAIVAAALFGLGLLLRAAHLDVPFVHDQDVQRLFTGALPLGEILTGKGLEDRHPPLWFVVLHVAGWFGDSEAVMRAPAVIAGALVAPAIVWGARLVRGRAGPLGAVAALRVAVSPEFVARSREVSEIPLFALLVVVMCSLVVAIPHPQPLSRPRERGGDAPSEPLSRDGRGVGVRELGLAATTALLAWTYYLAPLVIAGVLVGLWAARKPLASVARPIGLGALLGAPAFVLLFVTIVRDHGAREVAERFPDLAWGAGEGAGLGYLIAEVYKNVGPGVLVAVWAAMAGLMAPRCAGALVPCGALLVTMMGVSFASKFARVQPYYVGAVAPVLALAIALAPRGRVPMWIWSVLAGVALSLLFVMPRPRPHLTYLPDADAFMPRFAAIAASRSEKRFVTVAHYDATLLAYYLKREANEPAEWPRTEVSGEFVVGEEGRRILPLVQVHRMEEQTAEQAREKLRAALAEGPALVIERDAFVLAPVHDEIARCEVLVEAPSARLVACGGGGR